MKKLIYKYSLIIGLLFFATSCEDYLDEPQPTSAIPYENVFSSEAGVEAYFNGIYRNMRQQWQNDVVGSSTDTWGLVSLNLARILKGDDITLPLSSWYLFDYRYENREAVYRRTLFVWSFLYETVNQANILIDGVEKSTSLSEEASNRFIAQARALRAWAYFELIREYQHTYSFDPSAPGVPIYNEPATIDSKGNPRGTVEDVYNFIVDDLEYAVQHLGEFRTLKSNININVANGLLARVYLEMQNWEGARDAAVRARQGYSLSAETYSDGFNDIASPEWMWGFPQSPDQTIYYGNHASHFNHLVLGYNSIFINEEFVAQFSPTDVRALFIENFYGVGGPYRWVTEKFAMKEDFSDDFVMMRVAEMYLIEAEAKAELGDNAGAAQLLFELQSNRDPQAVASGNSDRDLIDEILIERRKELYGEFGVHFLDIKRRQLPLIRTGNHPPAFMFQFPANANEFILKIPQNEIDANENISDQDQNP